METKQLPAPQTQEQEHHHPIVTLVCIGIAVCWLFVFVVGMAVSHGGWAAWWTLEVVGVFVAIGIGASHVHERHKAHQLHQEDIKDRAHHRNMAELAIRLDHSAEHITATTSFRTISKFMGPQASITVRDNNLGQQQLPAPLQQPQLSAIIEDLIPNALEFAYGYDPQLDQLVKATLPKAVHIQLVGASGQGKSRQATSILTQLTTRNDPQHLQLALIDHEGETSAPFTGLPHVQFVADEPKEAARIFRALVKELDRRDIGRIAFPVLLVFCEEFLNLRRTMPVQYRDQALEDYTSLALRGRKRGMFLFSIGQTAYTERSIRDAQAQFLSSMAFALKPTTARSAGFTNTELLNQLYSDRRPGQFLLERPAGDALLLAPYVDSHIVSDLLGVESSLENGVESGSQFDDTEELRNQSESGSKVDRNQFRNQSEDALEASRVQVCSLLSQGIVNKADIIQAVWNVKPGNSEKYRTAETEFKTIMAQIARSN